MPQPARANTNPPERPSVDEASQRPRTLYVDFAKLESAMNGREAMRVYSRRDAANAKPTSRRVTTVDREVKDIRRNVRDAARAVLTWLAFVSHHDGAQDMDRVLDRCLRPGPDASAVNYAALAQEINETLGLELSAKRVQTAVRHLRNAAGEPERPERRAGSTLAARYDALEAQLRTNHDDLVREQQRGGHALSRAVAHDVLGVLRSAAGRLIECGFGEGIPRHTDLDATRQRFLGFVRRVIQGGFGADSRSTLRVDIARLLSALHDHDGSAEADMRLVTAGACVVADLAGPDALPGVMARLNLLMVGRPMLETGFFVEQMLKLADAAGGLVNDRATQTYMAWVRLQPEDRRTPGPNRVRSYCLNNASTHVLQRLYTGELVGAHWFETAQECFDTMQKHDRGFRLLKTTEAIMLCVLAGLTQNNEPAGELFKRLGYERSLDLLRDLARFDNSAEINRLVRRHADAVHAGIGSQLLVLPC